MSVRVYIMTVEPIEFPIADSYIPMQIGHAMGEELEVLVPDDTGDSISEKYKLYGELTGIYQLWKNPVEADIISISHHGRFFVKEADALLKDRDYEEIMGKCDVMISQPVETDQPYCQAYMELHPSEDLELTRQILAATYPGQELIYDQIISENHYHYGDIFAMRAPLFKQYCSWLFSILDQLEEALDPSLYDGEEASFSRITEALLMTWIISGDLQAYECPIGLMGEKPETAELKQAVEDLLKLDQVKEAQDMYYQALEVQPSLRSDLSDLNHELPDIELLLYICEQEQLAGIHSMLDYSQELAQLIEHVRTLKVIASSKDITEDQLMYLSVTKASDLALELIEQR